MQSGSGKRIGNELQFRVLIFKDGRHWTGVCLRWDDDEPGQIAANYGPPVEWLEACVERRPFRPEDVRSTAGGAILALNLTHVDKANTLRYCRMRKGIEWKVDHHNPRATLFYPAAFCRRLDR